MLLYYYYKKWDLLKWNLLMLNSFIYKGMQQLCLNNFTCEHFNWLNMFWSFECWCTGLSDWNEEPASTLCLLSFFWSYHNSFNQSILCYQIFEGAKSLRQILKRTQNRFLKQNSVRSLLVKHGHRIFILIRLLVFIEFECSFPARYKGYCIKMNVRG